MKKYLVKRYIESIDPSEVNPEDRDYKNSTEDILEAYGMQDFKLLATDIYQEEEAADIYMIKKDEAGYYAVTYTCVQNEEIDEEAELFELFRFRLLKLDEGIFVSAHDPELHTSEYEECILIVKER